MTLKPKQVREVRITLGARGIAMPKTGWVVKIPQDDQQGLRNVLGTHYPPKSIARDASGYYLIFSLLIMFGIAGCASVPVQGYGGDVQSGYPTGEEVNAIVAECEKRYEEMGVSLCAITEIQRRWPDTVKP